MKIFVVIALMMATVGAMHAMPLETEESRAVLASGGSRLQGELEGVAADSLQAIADRIATVDVTALNDFIAKTAGVETDVPAAIDGLEAALGGI